MIEIPLYMVDDGCTFTVKLEHEGDECYCVNQKFDIEKTYFNKDVQEWFPDICFIQIKKEYEHDLMDKKYRWDRVKAIVDDINKEFYTKLKEVFEKLVKHCGPKCEIVYAQRREPQFYPEFKRHKVYCTLENSYWIVAIIRSQDVANNIKA